MFHMSSGSWIKIKFLPSLTITYHLLPTLTISYQHLPSLTIAYQRLPTLISTYPSAAPLIHISPTSHPHLPHISPTSPPHPPHISPIYSWYLDCCVWNRFILSSIQTFKKLRVYWFQDWPFFGLSMANIMLMQFLQWCIYVIRKDNLLKTQWDCS